MIYNKLIILIVLISFSCNNDKTPTKLEFEESTVTDIDENSYKTVKIGNQWWMTENLKVTHYRNGDAIPIVYDTSEWAYISTGAYCNYDNNENNVTIYGLLYNWYSVEDSRNIAPAGWHVPSLAEWETLIDYLGGISKAGGKIKGTNTTYWQNPNTNATNESGLSVLPGGYRSDNGFFDWIGIHAFFWSSEEYNNHSALGHYLSHYSGECNKAFENKSAGFSIRCVKD